MLSIARRPRAGPPLAGLAALALAGAPALLHAQSEPDLRGSYEVVGDGIPQPLTSRPGDADSGRRIVTERQTGLCVLCHSGPFPEVRVQGDLATSLAGTGARWSAAQLRLRLLEASQFNAQTIMPSYYRTHGLARVGWQYRGQPVLSAQQIEDAVAFLRTLKD